MGRLTKAELREFNAENNTKFKLTTYHKDLYEYIRHNTESGRRTTVRMICDFLPEYYHLNAKPSNYSNCPELYEDIDYINRSPETLKIIIKDYNNFKLATKEEAEEYAEDMRIRALRLLAKAGVVKVKIKRDGQHVVPGTEIETVEGKVDVIDSFIDEINDKLTQDLRELDCQIVCRNLTREEPKKEERKDA